MVVSLFKRFFGGKDAPAAAPATAKTAPAPAAASAGGGTGGGTGDVDLEAFVTYVVQALVDAPAEVVVKNVPGDRQTTLQVSCKKGDVGKIIGKSGIRALVNGAAGRMGQKVNVEILD